MRFKYFLKAVIFFVLFPFFLGYLIISFTFYILDFICRDEELKQVEEINKVDNQESGRKKKGYQEMAEEEH